MHLQRWIITGLLLLCGMSVSAQSVSITDLARHDEYLNVKISPDGAYMAATAVAHGQTVLAMMRLGEGGKDKSTNVLAPRDDNDVIDFWWVSPTRLVYSVGIHQGGYDAPLATGELFAVNADGGSPQMLYGFRKVGMSTGSLIQKAVAERGTAQFIASIPDNPNHILVSISLWDETGYDREFPTAWRMDVRSGTKTKLVKAPMRGAEFLADHQGRIRFAFAEANDGSVKVYLHPLDGDGWQLLPEMSAARSTPLAFNRDDTGAYVTCAPDAGGFGVCLWDANKHTLTTLWSHPKVGADGLVAGLARDSVAGVAYMDGRPGTALFDGDSGDAQALKMLMQQFPGENTRFVSGSTDGSLSVLLVEADADAGAFYLYNPAAHKLSLLAARAKWIHPERMASKQPFAFAARDGLQLQGYVSYPPNRENAKQLPTVVLVHGGPYGVRDRWDYDPLVQAMATRGYAVVQVNFRGSGGYGYDFMHAGTREWGGKMQDDVTDATRWAIAQGIANPKRICIFGASYGGYAALEGAVKEPDLYQCAIGYVGVYDLALMFRRGDTPQSTFGKDYLKREVGDDMTKLAARSPVNQLDSLKAKVMLVVGGKDERVPPIQGLSLHQALLNRQIAHEWLYKPDEMHGFYDEANLAELYTRLLQFLGSSIGPGAVASPSATADVDTSPTQH
ncbi:MAG: alpha/beta fold hydrolase [Rhodanobacter sp.]